MKESGIRVPAKPNHYWRVIMTPSESSYRTIPLTKGQVAIVDAIDYELVSQWRWHSWWNPKTQSFYAHRRPDRVHVFMHRVIMGLPTGLIGLVVDHINQDTLDNRRSNLRIATYAQNSMNKKEKRGTVAGLKGVSAVPSGKWQAAIWIAGRNVHLGTHETKEAAHAAYCDAATIHYGEYSRFGCGKKETRNP